LQAAVEPAVLKLAAGSMTRRVAGQSEDWKASFAAAQTLMTFAISVSKIGGNRENLC